MLHFLLVHRQAEQLPQSVHVLWLVIAITRGIMLSGCMFSVPFLWWGSLRNYSRQRSSSLWWHEWMTFYIKKVKVKFLCDIIISQEEKGRQRTFLFGQLLNWWEEFCVATFEIFTTNSCVKHLCFRIPTLNAVMFKFETLQAHFFLLVLSIRWWMLYFVTNPSISQHIY